MVNWIKRIRIALRHLRAAARGSALEDNLTFKDELTVTLRDKDGKIIRQWKPPAHSWNTDGKQKVRDALADGGFTKISYMFMTAVSGASEQDTTNTKPADNKAQFVATWPTAGLIDDITAFHIRQTTGGANLATISVTSFDKPDGIELEVTWQTTIT